MVDLCALENGTGIFTGTEIDLKSVTHTIDPRVQAILHLAVISLTRYTEVEISKPDSLLLTWCNGTNKMIYDRGKYFTI